jgi:hypothetical protein
VEEQRWCSEHLRTANRDIQQGGRDEATYAEYMLKSRPQIWLHRLEYRARRGGALSYYGLPLSVCGHRKAKPETKAGVLEMTVRYYNFFLCSYTCLFFSLLSGHLHASQTEKIRFIGGYWCIGATRTLVRAKMSLCQIYVNSNLRTAKKHSTASACSCIGTQP